MHIINKLSLCVMSCVLNFPIMAFAENSHPNHQSSHQALSEDKGKRDNTHHGHGDEMYQVTQLENAWLVDDDEHKKYVAKLTSMIGTDENRVYVKVHVSKSESMDATYSISTFYSRKLDDFWDAQIGLRYRENQFEDAVDTVFGLHGLAPYFFESDLYLYIGEDQYFALGLSFERDLLLTQKLITQPYIELDMVFNDDSNYPSKTGISELQVGFKTRYEINKRVKPFVDIGYVYEKGQAETFFQQKSTSESNWRYGLGLALIF